MAAPDSRWQHMAKARRASVYRAIGRAARAAREDHDPELVGDLRIAMELLRAHARAPGRAPAKRRVTTRKARTRAT